MSVEFVGIPVEIDIDKNPVGPLVGAQFQHELWTHVGKFVITYDWVYYPETGKRTAILRSVRRILEDQGE